jgi:hypothetical protein
LEWLYTEKGAGVFPIISPGKHLDGYVLAAGHGYTRDIVIVCGGSASMEKSFPILRQQLKLALSKFRVPQTFNVIFLQDQSFTVFDAKERNLANVDNRRRASSFVEDLKFVPSTHATPGMMEALRQNPEMIYFLTNSDFKDSEILIKKIREMNAATPKEARRVKINTIAFITTKEPDAQLREMLKTLAAETGGEYNVVLDSQIP